MVRNGLYGTGLLDPEVVSRQTAALNAVFDGVNRVGQWYRVGLLLVRFHKGNQGFQLVAFKRI